MKIIECGVEALIVAWFLALFGFNTIVVNAMKEMFNLTITDASYYFSFFIIGFILGLIMTVYYMKYPPVVTVKKETNEYDEYDEYEEE